MALSIEQLEAARDDAMADGNMLAAMEIDDDIMALDKSVQETYVDLEKKDMTFGDWMSENAKQGSVEGLGFLSGAASAINDELVERTMGGESKSFLDRFNETTSRNREDSFNVLQDLGVYNENEFTDAELRAADPTGGIATQVVRGMADPTGLIGAPASVAGAVVRTGFNALASVTGDLAGKATEYLGGNETTQLLISMGVGALSGFREGVVQQAAQSVKSTEAAQTLKNLYNSKKDGGVRGLELSVAGATARNLLKDAAENDFSDLDATITKFDKIKDILGVEGFPVMLQLSENAVLKEKYLQRVSTDPSFRAEIKQELDSLVTAISNKSNVLFGVDLGDISKANINPRLLKEQARSEALVAKIDQRLIEKGTDLTSVSTGEIGKSIENLINTKMGIVKSGLSASYDRLNREASAVGVFMSGKGAKSLHQSVIDNDIRDIFGKGTDIDKKTLSKLGPVTKTLPNGVPYQEYPSLSFEQVMSIKNALNDSIRRAKAVGDGKAGTKLGNFKRIFIEQRKLLGEWDVRLEDVDREYYQKMGVPFQNQTINDLTGKNYAELVAPVLLNKKTAADQFLETVPGAEGQQVLQNTIMSKLFEVGVDRNTMQIDQRKLSNFIKDKKDIIQLVPGLDAKLTDVMGGNANLLTDYKNALDAASKAKKDVAAAKVLSANPDLEINLYGISRTPSNTKAFVKFLDQVNKLDPESSNLMMNKLRREIVREATNPKNGNGIQYLTANENSAVIKRVMGAKYMDDLNVLAEVSDSISNIDPNQIMYRTRTDSQDIGMRAVNVPSSTLFSIGRDRIMSGVQKAFVIFSKSSTNSIQKDIDAKTTEMFLDPATVTKMAELARQAKKRKGGINYQKYLEGVAEIMERSVLSGTNYAANRESSRQETNREELARP